MTIARSHTPTRIVPTLQRGNAALDALASQPITNSKIIMGRSRYTITEPDKPQFREHAGLRLYGYVVLENHLHFIAQAHGTHSPPPLKKGD